ncbi:histidine phosphatase family protein [Compostimonas suwonensis]|uniref:Putative phosphoglycerate mutase n=1 Tax=Compostimonas suwonensis TaxID=1048394 RepID=A0A2M9C4F2_9MICO|nr:histidine phosphatase family protein [Compostimonas suwonensis]PJJ65396.1 putative phosphoglycerate mutase [Compostimonas suwonensis]
MTTTTLALIRHGQTDWNAMMRIQGSTDIPLNDTGRQQARDAAASLVATDWDLVVSSPLSRAAETADIIATALGFTVSERLPELAERHYGPAEGLSGGEELDALREPGGFRGAEPETSVVGRGIRSLSALAERHPGARILVVSHGALIRLTTTELLGEPVEPIDNAALTLIRHRPQSWSVELVNGSPV